MSYFKIPANFVASRSELSQSGSNEPKFSTQFGRIASLLAEISEKNEAARKKEHVNLYQFAALRKENAEDIANEVVQGALASFVGNVVGNSLGLAGAAWQGTKALAASKGAERQLNSHMNQPAGAGGASSSTPVGQEPAAMNSGAQAARPNNSNNHRADQSSDDASSTRDRSDHGLGGSVNDATAARPGDPHRDRSRETDAGVREGDDLQMLQLQSNKTQLELQVAQAIGFGFNSLDQMTTAAGDFVKATHEAERTILEAGNEALNTAQRVAEDNMSANSETSGKSLDVMANILRILA